MQRCLAFRRFYSVESPTVVSALLASNTQVDNVRVQGWVRKTHRKGKISFVHVDDGLSRRSTLSDAPTILQVVLPKEVAAPPLLGSAVEFEGQWLPSAASGQSMELLAKSCRVLAIDEGPQYMALNADGLRKQLHLRTRAPAFAAVLRTRSRLLLRMHQFFQSRDYVHIDVPVLTANDCEGAGETFSVSSGKEEDFFGDSGETKETKRIFLSVSGQLHLEAVTAGIARAYTIDSGIRAERQQSRAHLSEFRMLEVETAFCDNVDENCDLAEDLLRFCAEEITENDLKRTEVISGPREAKDDTLGQLRRVSKLPRLRFDEVIEILKKHGQPLTGGNLSKRNELFLVEHVGSPLFVTHFPASLKPFYMQRTNGEETLTDSFDLLCPLVGEIVGGSVREASAEALRQRTEGKGLEWYEELRRRGKPVSAGFGLGIERLVQTLLGIPNIKDTIPFPRWYRHCQC